MWVFTKDPETVKDWDSEKERFRYNFVYFPTWTFWAVVGFAIATYLTKAQQLSACITGSDPTNYLTSTNGTCTPGNYDPNDPASMAFIIVLFFFATLNQWVKAYNYVRLWFNENYDGTGNYFHLGFVSEVMKFVFIVSYLLLNTSGFSPLQTKSTVTMNYGNINANTTINPPNYRNSATDPAQIASMVFMCFAVVSWLPVPYWMFYDGNVMIDNGTEDIVVKDYWVRFCSMLSTLFLAVSVGCNIGPTLYYNVGNAFPVSLTMRQYIAAAAGLFSLGLAETTAIVVYTLTQSSEYESLKKSNWKCWGDDDSNPNI